MAAVNVALDLCVDLEEAFEKGDLAKARQWQARLIPINQAVTTSYGIAGLKALLDRIGYYGGPPRSPLRPPGAEIAEKLLQVYNETCGREIS